MRSCLLLIYRSIYVLALLTLSSCVCGDRRSSVNRTQTDGEDTRYDVAEAGIIDSEYRTDISRAAAQINPLRDQGVRGTVSFSKVPEGVLIIADIDGLAPGKHGFHIHEFGVCELDGSSAGGHFNPTGEPHGGPSDLKRHVGDLGNLEADSNGHAHYEMVNPRLTFSGKDSILGRSLLIHHDVDDYKTQPTGASGGRVACGIIRELTD